MCHCAKVFQFPAPLWRVIRGGSSVRWMCNSISDSFSFFLSLLLAFSAFLSVSAILSWGNWPPFTAPSGAVQHLCVLLAKGRVVYADLTTGHDSACVRGITHTHTHSDYSGSTCRLPPGLFSSVNCSFKSLLPCYNGKRRCSYTFWLLVTDLMACKFPFVGEKVSMT